MLKNALSLLLSALMLHASGHASLGNDSPKERSERAQLALKVKAGVMNLGTGKSARVRVVLNDKTRYHGHITEITEDHFVVADAKTGATAPIHYPEVKSIKGNNLSTGAKIGIGVAIAAAVAVVVGVLESRDDDDNRFPPRQPPCDPGPCGIP